MNMRLPNAPASLPSRNQPYPRRRDLGSADAGPARPGSAVTRLLTGRSLPVARRRASPRRQDTPADQQDQDDHAAGDQGRAAAGLVVATGGRCRVQTVRGTHRGRDAVAVPGLVGRPDVEVVLHAVLDQPDATGVGLRLEAREPVAAEGLADGVVRRDEVGRVAVEDLLHLLDL